MCKQRRHTRLTNSQRQRHAVCRQLVLIVPAESMADPRTRQSIDAFLIVREMPSQRWNRPRNDDHSMTTPRASGPAGAAATCHMFRLCFASRVTAYVLFMPVLCILLYLFTVGRDPSGLHMAVVNEDSRQCAAAWPGYPADCNGVPVEHLSCRFLGLLKEKHDYILVSISLSPCSHGSVVATSLFRRPINHKPDENNTRKTV